MQEGSNTDNLQANGAEFIVESYDPDFGLRVSKVVVLKKSKVSDFS